MLRVSRYLMRGLWRVWPRAADLRYASDAGKREDFLGTFAPFFLVTMLMTWVVMLVIGWGLFFYGLRDQLRPENMSFASAVYYAGASLLTIGYGDIVAQTTLARMMSLLAATTGLGVVAVVTSFLFAVFGAFQNREAFVVSFSARAGVPPSGVGLLALHAQHGIREDLAQVFRDGQDWTARVMESHLAYPVLIMFRSSHDYESWLATLGALLDAAALVLSTLDAQSLNNGQTPGQARVMYELGRHLTADFADYFTSERETSDWVGIERHEFDGACAQLGACGYRLGDLDRAWSEFSRLRVSYSAHLNALARWLQIPPIQWVGDRSMIMHHAAHRQHP